MFPLFMRGGGGGEAVMAISPINYHPKTKKYSEHTLLLVFCISRLDTY